MDPVTHVVAGACIAAAIAPARHRRAALVLGAALNTLPDLDYLPLAFADPVARATLHRSFSHSLLVLPLVAFALWWLTRRVAPVTKEAPARWFAVFAAALVSHPLLDAMTVYGTQLFWPLDAAPVMGANLFIVDPLFTLPLIVAAVAAYVWRERERAQRWLVMGLALSAGYVGWTLIAKHHLESTLRAHFAAKGAAEVELLTMPTPLNSVLWRVLVMSGDAYGEGFYSFVGSERFELVSYPATREPPPALAEAPSVARLKRFTHGFHRWDRVGDRHVLVDLRMGAEPDYLFRFAVGEERDGAVVALDAPEQLPWPSERVGPQLRRVAQRIFSPEEPPAEAAATVTPEVMPRSR